MEVKITISESDNPSGQTLSALDVSHDTPAAAGINAGPAPAALAPGSAPLAFVPEGVDQSQTSQAAATDQSAGAAPAL
jgi:hypothetical protein